MKIIIINKDYIIRDFNIFIRSLLVKIEEEFNKKVSYFIRVRYFNRKRSI